MIDIVFLTAFADVNETYITNFTALRTLGDEKVTGLIEYLNGTNNSATTSGGSRSTGSSAPATTLLMLLSGLSVALLSSIIIAET